MTSVSQLSCHILAVFRTSSCGGAVDARDVDTRFDSCVAAAVDAVAASCPLRDAADRPRVRSPGSRGQCGPEKGIVA